MARQHRTSANAGSGHNAATQEHTGGFDSTSLFARCVLAVSCNLPLTLLYFKMGVSSRLGRVSIDFARLRHPVIVVDLLPCLAAFSHVSVLMATPWCFGHPEFYSIYYALADRTCGPVCDAE